jgi:catechol 2,3-dioxygenase-like lactoylglutathione lyase family enzyme
MISGIHHASITTKNIDALAAFYRTVLGFEQVFEAAWDRDAPIADLIYGLRDTAVRMVMLKKVNACLELFEFSNPVGKPPDPRRPVCDAGYSHICLLVADIAAEHARLTAAGMTFTCAPQHIPGLCKATYGRDPDGNIIELMEPDENSPFMLTLPVPVAPASG